MKKRLIALFLALAMGLALVACSAPAAENPDPPTEPSESPEPSETPSIVADLSQDVLAFAVGDLANGEPLLTVNGEPVSNALFFYALAYTANYYQSQLYYYGLGIDDYIPAIMEEACMLATYYVVLQQKAEELGCLLTDEQRATVDSALNGGEEVQQVFALFGLSEEDLLHINSLNHYYDNMSEILISAPTTEELNDFVYQVKHILLLTATEGADGSAVIPAGAAASKAETPYAGTAEEFNAEVLAKIEGFLNEIRSAEDPEAVFDALMQEHSEDGRDAEGNLGAPDGYVATPGKMVPEFEETAFTLAVGEVSEPVKTTYGYHILLRGEVENIEEYADDYVLYYMDEQINQWLAAAEVQYSDSLADLDVAEFYNRMGAWQQAYLQANSAAE